MVHLSHCQNLPFAVDGMRFNQHGAESSHGSDIIQIDNACLFVPNKSAIAGRA